MSVKAGFPCALVTTLLGLCTALAGNPPTPWAGMGTPVMVATENPADVGMYPVQMPAGPGEYSGQMPPGSGGYPGQMPGEPDTYSGPMAAGPGAYPGEGPSTPSAWMRYARPFCCFPIGAHGPILTELYMQTGPSLPIGGGVLEAILDTGWDVQGGGRSLFFNADLSAAWTIDLNVNYIYNHAKPGRRISLESGASVVLNPMQVEPQALHRTCVNAGFGREWYLYVWGNDCGPAWRAGFDGGPGLGSSRIDLNQVRHRQEFFWRARVAIHTDLEVPHGCCTYFIGARAEWEHDWMGGLLQSQNNSNLQDANFLLTLGVRY
jgi:hypothetical protein